MQIVNDNILNQTEGLIVHGANAQGVMGSGLALQIKNRYPLAYTSYKNLPTGQDGMGACQIVRVTDTLYIGNCITQLNYGRDGKIYADLIAVKRSLDSAFFWCDLMKQKLHTPEIGCGLGGLKWEEVNAIFESLNKKYPSVEVTLYRYTP